MIGLKRNIALLLAGVMTAGSAVPVHAAYSYSSNEIMYLKGVKLVSGAQNSGYSLFDVDGDYTDELFYKKNDTLSIWTFNKKSDTAAKKLTVKKADKVYVDSKRKSIFVSSKKGTVFSYKLKNGSLSKIKDTKEEKRKPQKNSHLLTINPGWTQTSSAPQRQREKPVKRMISILPQIIHI